MKGSYLSQYFVDDINSYEDKGICRAMFYD